MSQLLVLVALSSSCILRCFLFFSDPRDNMTGFKISNDRGGGIIFGKNVTDAFLAKNSLSLLVRSHEVQMRGFLVQHDNRVVTIFSAPNYCGVVGNIGAVLRFDEPNSMLPRVIQFSAVSAKNRGKDQ